MLPGMGVDPAQVIEMQKVSQYITAELKIDYTEKSVVIKLDSDVAEAAALIPQLLSQFTDALAQQLNSFFAITCKIIEVNKPES